jgi:integrase
VKTTLGILRVTLKYSFARGGMIYFQRAIPDDLQARYGAKRVKVSLETGDIRLAAKKVEALNQELEAEWSLLRGHPESAPKNIREQAEDLLKKWGLSPAPTANDSNARDVFYDHLDDKRARYADGDEVIYRDANGGEFLNPVEVKAAQLLAGTTKATLSDALDLYLKVHPKRADEKFATYQRRAFMTLIAVTGDKAIEQLSRDDAHKYVSDEQSKGNKTATIRRRINTIKAVIETYLREKGINWKNPFSAVPIPTEGEDTKKRKPLTATELSTLLAQCKTADDDIRWLIAILADTGARLAEITGLALNDITVDGDAPHVTIKPHPWRSLKNKGSERTVPLVGHALWAAQRIIESAPKGQLYAFPRYTTEDGTKATHASNTVAKWMRSLKVDEKSLNYTAHELRHTMADRLRDVQCPEDIRFAIGGWASQDVGSKYGTGYGLKVKAEWLSKVAL